MLGFFFFIFVCILFFAAYIGVMIVLLPRLAFRDNVIQVSVFGDFLHIITWELNEGVVLLRNKKLQPSTHHSGVGATKSGGYKFISPFLGHEVFARVPLSPIETKIEINNILTIDRIRVSIHGILYWGIKDLDTVVDKLCPSYSDEPITRGQEIIFSAEDLLKVNAEKIVRRVAAKKSLAPPAIARLIISLEASYAQQTGIQLSVPSDLSNPLDLDEILEKNLAEAACELGIKLEYVVSEIRLPQAINEAIEQLWRASLLPVTAIHEARAKAIAIKAMESLIGMDATITDLLLKNLQGMAVFQIPIPDILKGKWPPNLDSSHDDDS